MRINDIIRKKRDGYELGEAEIKFFVSGIVSGEIPDYQASALLMAMFLRGMTDNETTTLTLAMAYSGSTADLSSLGRYSADKHSTGGVGDKTTLVVAPLAASLGCRIAKMSGRGLGHTGGTVDKLESIPGFRVSMNSDDFLAQAKECGVCVIGAGAELAPADKKLYALRDVTSTVDSIPLIVSSIMSKKIAGGSHNIVLDVKTGSGAFMKTVDDSRALAEGMVRIGKNVGRNVTAVITDMDIPLGSAIGNALEVRESVEVLRGMHVGTPLYEVCITLAAELASLTLSITPDEARAMAEESLKNGRAYSVFLEWIKSQGGDFTVFDNPDFGMARYSYEVCAPCDGYIVGCDAEGIGVASMLLGAGRATKEDSIDYTAGIINRYSYTDRIGKGDVIATLYASDRSLFAASEAKYIESLTFGESPRQTGSAVIEIIR